MLHEPRPSKNPLTRDYTFNNLRDPSIFEGFWKGAMNKSCGLKDDAKGSSVLFGTTRAFCRIRTISATD